MSAKRKPQKSKYFKYCTEKFGKPVFWHKSNWQIHVDRHEKILTDQQTFIDTLEDPDVVFPDLSEEGVSCYYRIDAFEQDGHKSHSQVIVYDNPNSYPPPTNEKYSLIKSAMDRPDIPEEGKMEPKFDKRKK